MNAFYDTAEPSPRIPGPRPRWRLRLAGSLAAAALILSACSGATPTPTAGSPAGPSAPAATSGQPAGGGSAVAIKGFAFNPASLTVSVGTTVTWTNQDNVGHTVTADDGSFGSQTVGSGQTFSQTFSKAGSFTYHCKIHPTMTATIVVQ